MPPATAPDCHAQLLTTLDAEPCFGKKRRKPPKKACWRRLTYKKGLLTSYFTGYAECDLIQRQ